MNRLKLWLYVALLLGAGTGSLYFLSNWLTVRAVAQIDHDLRVAATQVDARSQLLAAEAAQLADAVARDPSVAQALSADAEGDAGATAQSALESALRGGSEPGQGLLVATAGRTRRSVRVGGRPVQVDARAEDLLSGAALEVRRREGHVVAGDALFYVVAVPAARGASVAVGMPVSPAWLGLLRAATGADLTLLLEGRPPRSTLPPSVGAAVASAARSADGKPVGAGSLAPQRPTFATPFPLPALPLLFASAPAHRVEIIALKGLPGGAFALSEATAPLLAPVVSYVWLMALALAVLLLVGVVIGFLVTNEQKAMVPKDLVAAADRIASGDFTARAPVMAGALGTLASALNRAAEAAQDATPPAPARGDGLLGAGSGGEAPPQVPSLPASPPSRLEPPAARERMSRGPFTDERQATPAAIDGAPALATAGPGDGWPPPAPEEPAARAPSGSPFDDGASPFAPARIPGGSPAAVTSTASRPARVETRTEDLLKLSAPGADARPPALAAAATPGEPGDDEAHWQAVYEEFLRVRETCGEPREGVPYDRFRQKLQKNRDQLVAKYACRAVRFQVYVKEGKAALKASPLR
jgi:HAMP domain-containing protein